MSLEIRGLSKSYKSKRVIENLSIKFEDKKINCILGVSGAGKTTLLNILAGLLDFEEGEVIGKKENIGYVFQEDRLIPWKTVYDNLKFIIKNKSEESIEQCLKLVGLWDERKNFPQKLSGGMRQRLSLARAFLHSSDLLLMDEPLKSLDVQNKDIIKEYILKLQSQNPKTIIWITHEIEEALELADYIYVMEANPLRIKSEFENDRSESLIVKREKIDKIYGILK